MRRPLQQTGGAAGWRLALLLAGAMLASIVPARYARAEDRLFAPADGARGKVDEAMRPKIIRHRFVEVNIRLLAPPGVSVPANGLAAARHIVLNLFEDAVLQVVLDRLDLRSPDRFTWHGGVEGVDGSQVTLAVNDGLLAGNVRAGRADYQVRYAGDGTHVIYQIDPGAFPRDVAPRVPPAAVNEKEDKGS
jgi:hypothetical protein